MCNGIKDMVKADCVKNEVSNLIVSISEVQQSNGNSFKSFNLCFRLNLSSPEKDDSSG
jgi:hypothetical protein